MINSWIEDNMQYYYRWNDRIDSDGIDKDANPEQYFSQLIVPDDHYSFIESDFESLLSQLSGNKKPGYAYLLYSIDNNAVAGKITYVVKESPADIAGLTRGAMFTKINGTSLSIDNYRDLTAQMLDEHTLTVRDENGTETDYSVRIAEFVENPVFLDTVYDFDGYKVGYLVYNAFVSDDGDFSYKYDLQLNDVFGKFRDENVNELILDLRYNTKGHIFSSMIMASLIVCNPDIKKIYAKYQYNESLQQIIKNEFGDGYLNMYYTNMIRNETLNNIGAQLKRVFVLTSPETGVMGEILVNGLQLLMNVVVVGNKTAGRNMFSIFLYEQDPEKQRINTWAIAPVVLQISNNAGNTDISCNPDVEVTESLHDKLPLGNIKEHVLSTALTMILKQSSLSNLSDDKNIIPQQLSVNYLQSLSINSVPRK
jgi:C-terminal processing protease CtpA/Prc